MASCSSPKTERIRGRKGMVQRARRMQRTDWLCEDCLAMTPKRYRAAAIVDHIIPLIQGGEDTDDNTRNLCDEHNEKRTAEQFGFKRKPTIGNDGWHIG
jgi:5-methylcytosine-specific restriction protein A